MVAVAIPSPTAHSQLDQAVQRVKEGSRAFAKLSIEERIRLAEQMLDGYRQVAEESVIAACKAKGIDPQSPTAGEEWLAGPVVTVRLLRLTIEALREIQKFGQPRIDPSWVTTLPDGRISIKVFPHNSLDAMLLAKHTADVHMEAGVNLDNLKEHQASFYKKPHDGRLCLVLGAGNVNSIPPTDCITKMFNEGTTCVLKMNPVNAYVGPFIERAFKPAIDRGFLAVVYGGADEGSYLVNHAAVDEIHITGSDKTHDAMVWGPPGPDRDARKARNEPLLKKAISSELGNITPVIVVPGPYDDGELGFQADNIAGMVVNNASFNCNSAKLLITGKEWQARGTLLERVERGLQKGVMRKAYYPGAEERWKAFTEGRKGLKLVGNPGPGELAYAMIPDVDPSNASDRVFHQEPWCTVLSEMQVGSSDPKTFLEAATAFCNDQLWGTLCATI
ncbi:MAG: aldehyde dehydrogenase family protein, partial [Myxococcaceae bacterium]